MIDYTGRTLLLRRASMPEKRSIKRDVAEELTSRHHRNLCRLYHRRSNNRFRLSSRPLYGNHFRSCFSSTLRTNLEIPATEKKRKEALGKLYHRANSET